MTNSNIDRLQNKTVKELKQICRDENIRGFSRLRKAELIELISTSAIKKDAVEVEVVSPLDGMYIANLEQLLLLPPSEFKALAASLNCVQGQFEYPGEFYVRVWEAYHDGSIITERQREAAENQQIEDSKGSYYTYYEAMYDNEKDGVEPFTDYNYFNENAPVTPTRTYEQWLTLNSTKQYLELESSRQVQMAYTELPF